MGHTELGLRERRTIEDMLNAKMPVDKIAAEIWTLQRPSCKALTERYNPKAPRRADYLHRPMNI